MRKVIFTIAAFVVTLLSVMGQEIQQSQTVIKTVSRQSKAETDLEWIQHFDPEAGIGGIGGRDTEILGGASRFDKDFLLPHVGKEISAVALGIRENWQNIKLVIKKGDDITTAEEVFTQDIKSVVMGWNYIKLDTPVKIQEGETVSIEYTGKFVEGTTPVGMDINNRKISEGCSYLITDGGYTDLSIGFGHIMIRALVGGDIEQLSSCVELEEINGIPGYAKYDSDFTAEISMSNMSYKGVSNITLSYTINGQENTEEIEFAPEWEPASTKIHKLKLQVEKEDLDLAFCITKVNGRDNTIKDTITKHVTAYDPNNDGDRIVLIEKFTGQACSICPSGERAIQAAIKGHEDRIARIDHHYGYYSDLFTISESEKTGMFFGVTGAPSCMVDRTKIEGSNTVVFHPGNMTAEMIFNEMLRPVSVSIDIKTEYNTESRELTTTVSGKGDIDLANKKINVVLTQSGYKAYQNSGGEDYEHNDFPIIYMTEFNGDALNSNKDQSYEMTFKCNIPESFSKNGDILEVDLTQLKVVAFISEWNTSQDSEVLNAAFQKVDTHINISNNNYEQVYIYEQDGKIYSSNENVSHMDIYNLSGNKIVNNNLPKGIYIVKITIDNETTTKKIIVK